MSSILHKVQLNTSFHVTGQSLEDSVVNSLNLLCASDRPMSGDVWRKPCLLSDPIERSPVLSNPETAVPGNYSVSKKLAIRSMDSFDVRHVAPSCWKYPWLSSTSSSCSTNSMKISRCCAVFTVWLKKLAPLFSVQILRTKLRFKPGAEVVHGWYVGFRWPNGMSSVSSHNWINGTIIHLWTMW